VNYFYRDLSGREIGPLPLPALAQLRGAGILNDTTQVRVENGTEWVECRTVVTVATQVFAGKVTEGTSQSTASVLPAHAGEVFKKYSWLTYAAALICFLLPFVEVSCQNKSLIAINGYQFAVGSDIQQTDPFSGQVQRRHVDVEPGATIALILTGIGLLCALIRKPEGNAIAALAGAGGVTALLTFKSKIESEVGQQGQGVIEVAFSNGFWLAIGLQFAGGLAQARAFTTAWSEGWRFKARHGIFLCALFGTTGIFYLGPICFDALGNRAPSQSIVGNYLFTMSRPHWTNPFDCELRALSFTSGQNELFGVASVDLTRKENRYVADDIERRAEEDGFDSQAFARAVDDCNHLPADKQPDLPAAPLSLLSIAEPRGERLSIKVTFLARKLSPSWRFKDRIQAWTQTRNWYYLSPSWPQSPAGVDSSTAALVGPVFGEESGKRAISDYEDTRKMFINDVRIAKKKVALEAEEKTADKLVADSVMQLAKKRLAATFKSIDFFDISVEGTERHEASSTGENRSFVLDAEIALRQTQPIYKLAPEQPSTWDEFQTGSPYLTKLEWAKKYARFLKAPMARSARLYELVSAQGALT
jgi:hypothetical protein